jgi:hypothetical protein
VRGGHHFGVAQLGHGGEQLHALVHGLCAIVNAGYEVRVDIAPEHAQVSIAERCFPGTEEFTEEAHVEGYKARQEWRSSAGIRLRNESQGHRPYCAS